MNITKKIFKAHTNNITEALCEIWNAWDPRNEPDLLALPCGRVFKWDATYAHYLCAKGRITETQYAALCEYPTIELNICLN
jgi:hypothetical protein